ncbi:leucine-rich repeat protein [Pelomyxa schiedti]|nr:leucine-rich repeat protein [Pelomyxa schiedti]
MLVDLSDGKLLSAGGAAALRSRSITALSLSKNDLHEVPKDVWNLEKLTNLQLGRNKLTSIPEGIGRLTNLTHLQLLLNDLSCLPDALCSLTQLSVLTVHRNKIVSLPANFGNLTALKALYLGHNCLKALPTSFYKLTNLELLFMSANQLTTLPGGFGCLTSLKELGVKKNKLNHVTEELGKLPKLQKLWLSGNQLTTVPESIFKLTTLTRLNISDNPLKTLPATVSLLPSTTQLSVPSHLEAHQAPAASSLPAIANTTTPTPTRNIPRSGRVTQLVPIALLCLVALIVVQLWTVEVQVVMSVHHRDVVTLARNHIYAAIQTCRHLASTTHFKEPASKDLATRPYSSLVLHLKCKNYDGVVVPGPSWGPMPTQTSRQPGSTRVQEGNRVDLRLQSRNPGFPLADHPSGLGAESDQPRQPSASECGSISALQVEYNNASLPLTIAPGQEH